MVVLWRGIRQCLVKSADFAKDDCVSVATTNTTNTLLFELQQL